MATAASKPNKKLIPRLKLSAEKGNEILGVALLAAVVLVTGSLLTYEPSDPSLFNHAAEVDQTGPGVGTHNMVGAVGANLAALLFGMVGIAALLLPVLLGASAWRHLKGRKVEKPTERVFGIIMVLLSLPALLELLLGEIAWRGAFQRAAVRWLPHW